MKRFLFFPAILILFLSGCISNDLPFPRIEQYITALSARGESQPARIDNDNFSVTLFLDEDVDIENVSFSQFEFTEGASSSLNLLDGTYNLSQPLKVTISRYQDYEWTITAVQEIERWFCVEGQIGESDINATDHTVGVSLPKEADLSRLNLTAVKLGPAGITSMSPDLRPGVIDLSRPLEIDVTCFGRTVRWTVTARKVDLSVATGTVSAWSQVIWASGTAPENADNGFQYRRADSSEWIDVPKENITRSGGNFTACIPHLQPLTSYVVRAVSDGNPGNEVAVTTQATMNLVDGSFDQWHLQNGKIWNPWNEGGTQYWDTGNTGAATLGKSNVYPSDFTPDGRGQSACLETRFVGIGPIGKLAAGSIYTGKFVKVDGTNGILDFGRPFNLRPTKLRGYYNYTTVPINYASSEYKNLVGRPDTCHIYIALADWTAPYQVRTNPNNRQLFNANSPEIIAYGELLCGESFEGYREFEIRLNYRSYSRVPSYIQITCAASKYGDFFTGGTGATLYVDQFSLEYDY